MADLKIEIPAPCEYNDVLANKREDIVEIPAYDNREIEKENEQEQDK